MLVKGNTKLGKSIWCFSIPAGRTCPGRSDLCNMRCYAQTGLFKMPSVLKSHQRNFDASKLSDFVPRIKAEITKKRCTIVRIHVAGDYYSAEYTNKWYEIVKAFPTVRFFTYTRSWRIPEIAKVLKQFVKNCPNLKLWYSVDAETGYPAKKDIPSGVRIAYMSTSVTDLPIPTKTNLVFRDYGTRAYVQKYINGVLVCPPENGVSSVTCEKCGICWQRETPVPHRLPIPTRRVELSLVA